MKNNGLSLVVLAGGQATRLQKMGVDCPKSMINVREKPFVCWQIESLLQSGVGISRVFFIIRARDRDVFATLQHHITLPVTLCPEHSPRGTGGALLDIAKRDDISPIFLAMNGDVLFNATPNELLMGAAKTGAALQYVHVDAPHGLGQVRCTNNLLTSLTPAPANAHNGFVNAGLYAFKRDVLREHAKTCPEHGTYSFENDLANKLIKAAQISAIKTTSPFIDIGTPPNYGAADAFCRAFAAQYLWQNNLASQGA